MTFAYLDLKREAEYALCGGGNNESWRQIQVICHDWLFKNDTSPLSDEWLAKCGGIRKTAPGGNHYFDFVWQSDEHGELWLRVHEACSDGECPTEVYSTDTEFGTKMSVGLTKGWVKTRGEFRRLCSALGIEIVKD